MNYPSTLKCTLKPRITEQALVLDLFAGCGGLFLVFIFLLILFISDANAEGDNEQDNQKISIYLHPNSFFCVWMFTYNSIAGMDPAPFYAIYLTVEVPLNLSNSLIIQPSLLYYESSGTTYITHNEKLIEKMFRLGPGIGFRHFLNGKGDDLRLYLQAMSNIHYYSIKELDPSIYKKGFYTDLLGYLGFSRKRKIFGLSVCTFSDIGVGIVYPTNNSSPVIFGLYKKFLTIDANMGIGFSL
jgi:hypothetical protein